jgi:TetR/AcrR family transcriptional repressor of nem operon
MSSKQRLVDATAELLWQFGYQGTSPRRIQQLAGVGQGSMYHHFDGKAELARAAMEQLAGELRANILAGVGSPTTALGLVHAFLDLDRKPLAGCRIGRLVQDEDVLADDALREVTDQAFRWQRTWLAEALADGQATGELGKDFDPEEMAAVLVAIIQGGYVQARAAGDPRLLRHVTEGAKRLAAGLVAADPTHVDPERTTP